MNVMLENNLQFKFT